MIAQVKDTARRAIALPVPWLAAIVVPGFGFAWWAISLLLQMNTAWNNTAATLEQLKRETAALAEQQVAARARGDNRQVQINVLDRQVAVITARLQDILDLNRANSLKLDRLMEQSRASVSPSFPPN